MKKNLRNIDPELPENVGKLLSELETVEEFLVPEKYFDETKDVLKSIGSIKYTDESLRVPDAFFENQKESILGKLSKVEKKNTDRKESRKVIRLNYLPWLSAGIAASLVLATVFFFSPGKKNAEQSSFASLLEETELLPEDLEYFAEEEDYYNLYLYLAESDTIIKDSLIIYEKNAVITKDSLIVTPLDPKKKEPTQQNTKTTAPKKISIDELTDDEILEYLLEEGDDEFWND